MYLSTPVICNYYKNFFLQFHNNEVLEVTWPLKNFKGKSVIRKLLL